MTRREIQAWVPLIVLLGALIGLFLPLLIGERVLFWGLPTLQFYPWRAFAFDSLRAGEIPFWNPYNGAGAPLLANYQTALLYPPNWVFLLMNYAHAMSLLAVLHLFWAGLGMWLLAGGLGMGPLGRGISTLSYALGGYGLARMGSFPTADAVAWLPWLFWGVLNVVERRRALYSGLLAFITALLLLTGHAQTSFYGLLGVGFFALWLLWTQVPAKQRLAVVLKLGGSMALGVGLASIQLYLTAELLMQSQRAGGVSYELLTDLSFSPFRMINFLTPNFFGSPVDGSYLTPGRGVYFEDAVYLGLLPLIASVAALTGWVQRRSFLMLEQWRAFRGVPLWVGLAAAGCILALGKYGPIYRLLYEFVPTFDSFREPVRWMIWPTLALSILAGIGVENWGRTPRLLYWTRLGGAGGAGMALLGVFAGYSGNISGNFVPVLSKAMIALGCWLVGACLLTLLQPDALSESSRRLWQWAVLLFVAFDLVWAAGGLNPTVPPEFYRESSISEPQGRLYWWEDYEAATKFDQYFILNDYRPATRRWPEVRRSLLPNLNMLERVLVLNNFDPLQPQHHLDYLALIENQGEEAGLLLRGAGVGQVYGDVVPQGWESIAGEYSAYRAPNIPPLVWLVPNAVWVAQDDEAKANLLSSAWNPEQQVILQGNDHPLDLPQGSQQVNFFETVEDSPTHKSYRVVSEDGGYLVLAQTWYPGWSVSVDGQEQPLYRANLAFMAAQVPVGGGEVTFRYRPTLSPLIVALTLISFAIALSLVIVGLVRQP